MCPGQSCRQAWKGDKPLNCLEHYGKKGPVEYLSRAEVLQMEPDLFSGDLGFSRSVPCRYAEEDLAGWDCCWS